MSPSLSLRPLSFSSCCEPRHLHSFPTRRSSDLSAAVPRPTRFSRSCSTKLMRSSKRIARSAARATRSEEHTSELQSPDHLVCRLLLEKKKARATTQFHTPSAHTCHQYKRRPLVD